MSNLPTWTFRPDWSSAVLEGIEWRSAELVSTTGAEQVIGTRHAPRRTVEARYLVTGNERSFFDLTMRRLGSQQFLVPLWFHRATLTGSVAGGATSLPCDTVNREFRAGDFAVLIGADAFSCETVEIDSVSDTALTLASGVVGDWDAGTVLHPLRSGSLDTKSATMETDRIADFSVRFEIDAGEDTDGGAETWPLYQGLPVLALQANWGERLSRDFNWMIEDLDSLTGLRNRVDSGGQAYPTLRYGMLLQGRSEQAALRNLLRRLRGSQQPVWLPSYALDSTVAVAASSGASALEIERIGLAEIGGVAPDIAHLLVGTDLALEWDGLATPSSAANEKITLAAALTRDVAQGERLALLSPSRLAQDRVTIRHETDSEGAATVQLAWKTVDISRSGLADGDHPIPVAAMNATACGGCQDYVILDSHLDDEDYDSYWAQSGYAMFSPDRRYVYSSVSNLVIDLQAETIVVNVPSVGNHLVGGVIDDDGNVFGRPYFGSGLYQVADFGAGAATLLTAAPDDSVNLRLFEKPDGNLVLVYHDDHLGSDEVHIYNLATTTLTDLSWVGKVPEPTRFAQDSYGDIWTFGYDQATGALSAWRILDEGAGSAAPDTNSVTLATGSNSNVDALHTPSGWIVAINGGADIYLLDEDDFSILDQAANTSSSRMNEPTYPWLAKMAAGQTSFWLPTGNAGVFTHYDAATLDVIETVDFAAWGVGDTPLNGTVDYDPASDQFLSTHDGNWTESYVVLRKMVEC